MKLQTKISIQRQQHDQIDYNSKVVLLGSCFVENIGSKLSYYKFRNLQNPFGILFHPLAIESFITYAINGKEYTEDDIFFYNERWHCFEAHSKLSTPDKAELLDVLNTNIASAYQQLKKASHIIITLGTAWMYRYIETDVIVANCHKVPQKKFLKELITVEEVAQSLQAIISLIKSVNAKASVVFTVSPIRHLKDGFVENTQSKAHLVSGVHQLINDRDHVSYFPSYEIMMDELRDYRFYNEDMLHPNPVAINYIWEKFQQVWMTEETSKLMDEVDTIQKGIGHKPFNPDSEQHQKFIETLKKKQDVLNQKFPHIRF